MSKAPKGRKAGYLSYDPEIMKVVSWCMRNNISVSIMPDWKTVNLWVVTIKINGNAHEDPVRYKDKDALQKMYDYYSYYYEKYNKDA